MNKLFLIFFFFAFCLCASAQTSLNNPSDLSVNKKKWSFKEYDAADYDLSADVFKPNDDIRKYNQAIIDNARQNAMLKSRGMPVVAPPRRPMSSGNLSKEQIFPVNGYFIYETQVKNSSQKTIKSVVWDYVFTDLKTQQEAGRRRFLSVKNIHPNELKTLSEKSDSYPTGTIDASQGNKKFSDRYSEKILIQLIEYSDGSIWIAPQPN